MVKARAAVGALKGSNSSRATAAPPSRKTIHSGKKAAKAAKAGPRLQKKKPGPHHSQPIELYYWPTPNGWKITIMLEECRLPYVLKPVNIGTGEQFAPAFLTISANNRMPAIVDPQGPGGRPISVFESGAILQYLGRKTGKFYPKSERARVQVEEWLFWQMAGLGPMTGQANHFKNYAPEPLSYAIERYFNEVDRLFGVMEVRLRQQDYLAGSYSIADMACLGWVLSGRRLGVSMDKFPKLNAWVARLRARPAVATGLAVGQELRAAPPGGDPMADEQRRRVLFGQKARL